MTGLYGGLFAFISGSAFVFVDTLGLAPDRYGLCFAAIVVGYMAGTFAAGRLTLRLGIDRLVLAGTLLAGLGGLLMLGLAAAGVIGVAAVVGPFFVYMAGAGLAMPNAVAGAIAPFPSMAGAASALLGFVQMAFAAGVGLMVGQLVPAVVGTPYAALPMAAAAAGLALLAVLAQLALVRRAG
jgi:DHA1 family bicyclomycin/chloramphenicol resistance-like MFS transporter